MGGLMSFCVRKEGKADKQTDSTCKEGIMLH